jgi:hypothetical protein
MIRLLALPASLFPFNPATDSAMAHHHLILGYVITWGVHLGYLVYLGLKWRGLQRREGPFS